jgi:hypothetical protein
MSESFQKAVTDILARYRESIVDGKLTFREVMTLVYNAVCTFVRLAETLETASAAGASKKQSVSEAIIRLYDEVIAPIDIQSMPNFVEPIVDKAIRGLILTLADSAVEAAVKLFNQLGWGADSAAVTANDSNIPPGVHVIGA